MTIDARIEYVTTDDGVSLACTKFGSGPAVIYQFGHPSSSHFEMELAWPPAVATYQEFARIATVVRYDSRNTGLSTRGVEDVSIEAHLRDLEAVRRHFDLESVGLMFPFTWARVAVEYAAAQTQRVTALVLPYPQLFPEKRLYRQVADDVIRAAMAGGPELHATIRAVIWLGLEAHENAAWLARYTLESADFDDQMRGEKAIGRHDARAAAAKVVAPTLIIHRKLPQYNAGPSSAEMIREHRASITRISAAIPGAESALFEGSSLWYSGDEAITARSVDFLQQVFAKQSAPAADASAPMPPGGTRTVLFTDIVGHTEMMQRLGDTKGRDVLREHERITRETLKTHGGAEVKTMGDGFLASFGSVTSALDCAIALQRAFAAHNEVGAQPAAPAAEGLHVRVGLNAGEPIEEDGDLFGATVILASRIAARAGAGEILVPDTVRGLLSGKNFLFSDRGEFVPKGFDDAVRLYEVRWQP
jgi:class 3 adenylate cyclase